LILLKTIAGLRDGAVLERRARGIRNAVWRRAFDSEEGTFADGG
jgi:hypothetical protein